MDDITIRTVIQHFNIGDEDDGLNDDDVDDDDDDEGDV